MKNFLIPTLALFLLVFAGCQKEKLETLPESALTDQAAPDGTITTRSVSVPFKAHFETTVTTIGVENGIVTLNIDGVGKATHMGKSTMHSISMVNTNQFPWLQTGTQDEYTAANGDKLFGSHTGIAIPNEQGIVSFSGAWEITGGTGHFEGVTGSGTYEGTASLALGTGEITYDGTLEGL